MNRFELFYLKRNVIIFHLTERCKQFKPHEKVTLLGYIHAFYRNVIQTSVRIKVSFYFNGRDLYHAVHCSKYRWGRG